MKNLNKTNFFTPEWIEKFPLASKAFCEWIDEYKKEVRWTDMMCDYTKTTKDVYHSFKFHDIPLEMQLGIIGRFFCTYFPCVFWSPQTEEDAILLISHIWNNFYGLEKKLRKPY